MAIRIFQVLIFGFVCLTELAFSQPPAGEKRRGEGRIQLPAITGQILNQAGDVIPFASLTLFTKRDSTLKTGAATNQEGFFTIRSRPGMYFLRISFLSYKEEIISDIRLSREGVDLGKIILSS